jgi:hypothetical protein
MNLEGELVVHLPWDGHHVQGASVRSSRPFAAARVLAGKRPAQVVETVPMLFSVCGGAQRAAAANALAASGAEEVASSRPSDELAIVLETVQEGFWRVLIDWPQAMARQTLATPVATARHQIAAAARGHDGALAWENAAAMRELGVALGAIAAKSVYGMTPTEWLALGDIVALQAWLERRATLPAVLLEELLGQMPHLGRSDVVLMPPIALDGLIRAVVPAMTREPSFARAPTWEGVPVETGALARMRSQPLVAALGDRYGNSVATRMVARLAELATLLEELAKGPRGDATPSRVHAFALAAGEGLAAVQTARGLLLHRARVADGRVADYQIVAPTEWNFHPDGALVRGLDGLAADDVAAVEQCARLAVHALDPCVECRIEIGHA